MNPSYAQQKLPLGENSHTTQQVIVLIIPKFITEW